jgi:tRNA(fMet)-specific endonuclease VapC
MTWMLDTNIIIQIIRGRSPRLLERLTSHAVGEVLLSTISVAELWCGVAKSQHVAQNTLALEQFLLPLEIVPFDEGAARCYGPLRAALAAQGTPIGPLDTLIAAHALSLNATLVTNNRSEFGRVAGLRVEDWTATEEAR